ncbi:MAG: chorismate synthase, partial [Firmicutes bacterium]|nr:chorismate synthase [Bacillota bacterium]
ARPSHADLTAQAKYLGYQDASGGGHFSGRLTAPIVAACAVLKQALEAKGITINTCVRKIAGLPERPDEAALAEALERAAAEGDSLGGLLETEITGLEAGIGEPWASGLEGEIASAVFAVPAVKGVEFGAGFELADMKGSEANDAFVSYTDGRAQTLSNNSGGINGGISNGMPIVFRTAVRPTPSIGKAQQTVDILTGEQKAIKISGRHDPCIAYRACPVIDAVAALVTADLYARRFGYLALMPGAPADRNIVLIGMPSSGKTESGKELARILGRPFLDMDAVLEESFGMTIAGFFEANGEEAFRAAEARLAKSLSTAKGCVISTGGGVIKDPGNMKALKENGLVIWLNRSPELLRASEKTPLSRTAEDMNRLHAERLPLYEKYADLSVCADGTPLKTAEMIAGLLR